MFSLLHNGGLLLQQFLVDALTKIEGSEMCYHRNNQKKFLAASYLGLMDHIETEAVQQGVGVGRVVILPSTYRGSPRNMYQNFQDAMTIVRTYGKPDLFITFTANPNWPEILQHLPPHQRPKDRPDIKTRVFCIKMQQLKQDIFQNGLLGNTITYVYTIEFQKRGLPHAHILLFLHDIDKPRTPEIVDTLVSAEIPNPVTHPALYQRVKKHMIHGPCGHLEPTSPCMESRACKKMFPKPPSTETLLDVDGYPKYRRRERHTVIVRSKTVSDTFVVPYNPLLLMKYDCHINVEVCTTVKSIKYIFKYIHKGHDCASVEIRNGLMHYDEILAYINSRYDNFFTYIFTTNNTDCFLIH